MYSKRKIILPAILFIAFAFVQYFGLLSAIDNVIHDNIMVSTRPALDNIIIVGIDERSINEIGTWPWPRFFISEAILRLTEMDAAAVGVAVLYDTPGAVPEYDRRLVYAAMETDRLALGGSGVLSVFVDAGELLEIEHYIMPFHDLAEVTTVGFLNTLADESDGIMRRALTSLRFGDITVHSLPLEVYRIFRRSTGQTSHFEDIPLDRNGQFPIRYVGGPGSFTAVSLWGVINEEYHPAMFRDAIVLIGPYTQGIGEGNFTTPMNRQIATYGVEIYANIIQNFIEGAFLIDAPWWANLAILALVAFIVILIFRWLRPLPAVIAAVGLIFVLLIGARLAYDQFYIIINVGDSIIFLGLSSIANLIIDILSAQTEKQHIKDLFGRFVAPEVVNEIIAGGVDIQLGGVVKEVSALFVDIRGFTAFSEANPPEKVVDMINRYLGLTSTSIQKNSGTIDKFIGDATMALFNAPNNVPDHALCAVKAAWAMKQGAVILQKEIIEEYGVDLQFGIGINTGKAVVGNMGSEFRMDYTAIGDTINTAARLESSAEKGQIIISDATYQLVKNNVEVAELGIINVKNKKVGILVYSVIDVRE